MAIYESGEMYLLTIYQLYEGGKDKVRAIDISNELKRSKASVSVALGNLKNDGYLIVESNGKVILTKEGEKVAKTIRHRRMAVEGLLGKLGVDREIAQKDACRIEHVLSDESCEAIIRFIDGK